jgi:hypothetical protein
MAWLSPKNHDVIGECCQSAAVEHSVHLWRWAVTATAHHHRRGWPPSGRFILLAIVIFATPIFRRLHYGRHVFDHKEHCHVRRASFRPTSE